MPKDRWHSVISVRVDLPPGTRLRDVRAFLLSDGYLQSDDIFRRLRSDSVEIWQTETLINVHTFNGEHEIYFSAPYSGTCTHVVLGYLLPWLPLEHSTTFVAAADRLGSHFNSPATYQGQPITSSELSTRISKAAEDLSERIDAPGSEFLAIAIAEDLPL